MELSLVYSTFILMILLSIADPTQYDDQCPTSRRLLLFNFGKGEKKSTKALPSSPPKYARSGLTQGLPVYIQPQTSHELGHKTRSYTHLLKSKLYTNREKEKLKRLHIEKKKPIRKKHSIQHRSPILTKTQELIAIDNDEVNRCRALLHLDTPVQIDKKSKDIKKDKPIKQNISSKVKNITQRVMKNMKPKVIAAPINLPINDKKVKISKRNSDEKKSVKTTLPFRNKNNVNPGKTSSQSTVKPPIIDISQESIDTNEDDISEKNNSVVGRAYHFVKNMFQLSDDILDANHTEEDQIIDITNEQQQQQHHHHSRKLLSIDEDDHLELNHQQSSVETSYELFSSISKRQLLSVKSNRAATSVKTDNTKEKKSKTSISPGKTKPKVGWTYRYRISRYLEAQNTKGSGNKNKQSEKGSKTKQSQKQKKTISSSTNTKVPIRKLLEYNDDHYSDDDDVSDQDIVETVSITKNFQPKRQLLVSKKKDKQEDKVEKNKSKEELTDPVEIVRSYDRGLYKPRVGWQFRYRVSRYIDSLRENIREDQERLNLGLQDIKRKTPKELSGKRKRVSEKPIVSEDQVHDNETIAIENDLDPELSKISAEGRKVGWAYRYRIRRKLDYLKQQQAETGMPFNLTTLTAGVREKKVKEPKKKSTEKTPIESTEQKSENKSKSVGWKYRYRVSKMREAQKNEKAKAPPVTEKQEQPDLESAKHPAEDRTAGWKYRYRIRRKLDSLKADANQDKVNKKSKKKSSPSSSSKPKTKGKLNKNINKINQTAFMGYIHRTSSYVLHNLIPAVEKTICLLPLGKKFSFCNQTTNDNQKITPTKKSSKRKRRKKLKTKREHRAKQFLRSHKTKLGVEEEEDKATERRIDETMKKLYKKPSIPPKQDPPLPAGYHPKSSKTHGKGESVKKVIGIESKKNKKKHQIIGQEVKIKPKHSSPPSEEILPTTTTTSSPRLRTISEVIQEEADTILAPRSTASRTSEEIQEDINETNESILEQKKRRATETTTKPSIKIDRTTSGENDDDDLTSFNDKNSKINVEENEQDTLDRKNEKN